MTSLKTQKEIRDRIVALIASRTGVLAQSVGLDSPIWDHFPPSSTHREHPTVTAFVHDVHSEFNVYLTEEEWEEPTPDSIAEDIRTKQQNPEASVADWADDRAALKKGLISSFVIIAILFPAIFFVGSGPWLTRSVVGLGLPLFLGMLLLVGYRNAIRKLESLRQRSDG